MRNANEEKLIKAINTFSIDLYSHLKESENNLFFSPFSIFTALAMVYAGARGSTATQMGGTLHITLEKNRFHLALKNLLRILRGKETYKDTELHIANLMCVKKDYDLLERFLWIIDDNYDGVIWELDFSLVREACNKINAWVTEQTRGKIKNIIDSIDKDMALLLVNAIYFKGMWDLPFEKKLTQEEPFTLVSGDKVLVPMMRQTDKFHYFEDDHFQILEMSYKGSLVFGTHEQISMVVFLPKTPNNLAELERILSFKKIEESLSQLNDQYKQKVKVFFPRFTIKMQYRLSKNLSNLGMIEVFTNNADFTGIAKSPPLWISSVIHKAFVEVNEKGTEAAAVTAIGVVGASIGPRKEPPIFRADHPFIFLIQDSQTKTILFIGKLMNPKE